MNILAIETSSKIGSLSLRQGDTEKNWVGNGEISRSEDLLPSVERILSEGWLTKSQLDLMAVSEGPGSFTGLRVGISLARALAFSLGVKCLGVSMLEALAVAGSFVTDGQREFTSLVALAQKTWCRQELVVSEGVAAGKSEIGLVESDELFDLIKVNQEVTFVVDLDTYQRFFLGSVGKEFNNVISVGQNLATWIGIVAREKYGKLVVSSETLPNYLL